MNNSDVKELFSGVVAIFDDKINDPDENLKKIIKELKNLNFLVLKYSNLPLYMEKDGVDDNLKKEEDRLEDESNIDADLNNIKTENDEQIKLKNIANLSFIILDWKIKNKIITDEDRSSIILPDTVSEENFTIEFIKKINGISFIPIFIFSDEDVDIIESSLARKELFAKDKPSNLLIRNKTDFTSLVDTLKEWIEGNSNIYVLKKWETEYQKSKLNLFQDMIRLSSNWANVLWQNYKNDNSNPSIEFIELLQNNIMTRMLPMNLEDELMNKDVTNINKDELRQIVEGSMFFRYKTDYKNQFLMTGDLYKINDEEKYFLNIRPQCDLQQIFEKEAKEKDLYLIKGIITEKESNGQFKKAKYEKHQFIRFNDDIGYSLCYFIDGGKVIEFRFRDFIIKKESELFKEGALKIGRLLPPYITRIQQKFAFYLQRQGIPSLPKECING